MITVLDFVFLVSHAIMRGNKQYSVLCITFIKCINYCTSLPYMWFILMYSILSHGEIVDLQMCPVKDNLY